MTPELTDAQARVLGALIEKHMTTPDHYPLTTSSLRTACNQVSNREPVVDFDEDTVIQAVNGLRELGLARTVKRAGERAIKHLEIADEGLDIDRRQKALLAVLLLRGPQTSGELRSRTERYCAFADLADVEATLRSMEQADIPVARLHLRRPGQKEPRYGHLLGGEPALSAPGETVAVQPEEEAHPEPTGVHPVEELRLEVAALRQEVDRLRALVESASVSTSTP